MSPNSAKSHTTRGRVIRHGLHGARLLALALPVILIARSAIFGPSGFVATHRRRQRYQRELTYLHQLETENRQLNHSIQGLRTDPTMIEGIARQQLHLTRPGEVVYTYNPDNGGGSNAATVAYPVPPKPQP